MSDFLVLTQAHSHFVISVTIIATNNDRSPIL